MSPQSPRPAAVRPPVPSTPRSEPATADPESRSGLSLTQMAASAGAASSAAFAASYLGVAGTIIGAAVASVIATVATTMYSASLHRSREAVRRRTLQLAPLPWTPAIARTAAVTPGATRAPDTASIADTATRVLAPVPVEIAPEPPRTLASDRPGVRWGRVLPAAAAVLAITLGTLTGIEGALGRPLSALFGGSDTSGTSLSSIAGAGSDAGTDPVQKAPSSPEPTPQTEPTAEPTAGPTGAPTPTPSSDPTDEPSTEPTDPVETPDPTPTPEPTATATP